MSRGSPGFSEVSRVAATPGPRHSEQAADFGGVRVHSMLRVTPLARAVQAVEIACETAWSRSGAETVAHLLLPPNATQTVHWTGDSASVT